MQDILPNVLTDRAEVVLPMAAWSENEGCWENYQGRIQAFVAAVAPPFGVLRPGDVFYRLLGRSGIYRADAVRKEIGQPLASVCIPPEADASPAPEFQEL